MGWVFQGNPETFDIDDYVSRYPELIYWLTPRYGKEIAVGDRAFMWRAGRDAGVVAIGTVVELPAHVEKIKHPEALAGDLWVASIPDPDTPRTGIHLEDVRLLVQDGMVSRQIVKHNPVLSATTLIRMPNGTVFKLSEAETQALELLWGSRTEVDGAPMSSANEGMRHLRSHYVRERSSRLRSDKLRQFRATHGRLFCEICGEMESQHYPSPLGERIFEVHHRSPIARAAMPVRTTLDDLAVLCANCHRVVHASIEVDMNFAVLQERFGREVVGLREGGTGTS